jgi:hypothetical protein
MVNNHCEFLLLKIRSIFGPNNCEIKSGVIKKGQIPFSSVDIFRSVIFIVFGLKKF